MWWFFLVQVNATMYAMVCCRDHHEYSTWTKINHHISMNEPSNGTMHTMVCCRDHHEYSTWTNKNNILMCWFILVQVEYS
jgi:hypothetical protein